MAHWSRRGVVAGGAAGFGVALASPVLAQPESAPPVRVRRNVTRMAPNDPDLVAFASAIRTMTTRTDNLSWETQVQIHATSGDDTNPSIGRQHGTWRFLPWHRCQLYWFESVVAQVSGKPDFALPYWDWQETGRLPALFTDPSSPFFHAGRNPGIESFDFIANYRAFLNGAPPADVFGGSFAATVGDPNDAGAVETAGHNYAHASIGGDMGFLERAPRDPLFFFHHCNIDRVWATWAPRAVARGEDFDTGWLQERFEGYVDAAGVGARVMATTDLLSTASLGYRFDADYPTPFFDERPPTPPAGKTHRVKVSAVTHKLTTTMDPDAAAPIRLALPADLVSALAADQDQHFTVSGIGRVRSTDPGLNGSAIDIAVERVRKDCAAEPAERIASLFPLVMNHAHTDAMGGVMPGMSAPAAASSPATGAPAAATPSPPPTPSPPATPPVPAPVHRHGFTFKIGAEIYDTTGKPEPVIEIAVTAATRWLLPSTLPPPTLGALELDLVVTEYGWA